MSENSSTSDYHKLLDTQKVNNFHLEELFLKKKNSAFKRNTSRIFRLYDQCISYFKIGSEIPIAEIPLIKIKNIDIIEENSRKTFLSIVTDNKTLLLCHPDLDVLKNWKNEILKYKAKINNFI